MNNFKIKNEFNKKFLEYEFKDEDVNDTFSEGMVKNNSIDGILPLSFQQVDTKKYYTYNLSDLVSFSKYFENTTQKKVVINILKQIVNVYKVISEYMIEEKYILLDLNYMFIQPSTMKIYLVCLPIENFEYQLDLGTFIKRFIIGIVYEDSEDDFIVKILNFLNKNSSFVYDDLLKLLNQLINNSNQNGSNPYRQDISGLICPSCKTKNSFDSNYCIKCGNSLKGEIPLEKKTIKCPSCGKINNIDSKYCIKCGNSLTSKIPSKKTVTPPQEMTIQCPNCGKELKKDFLFCTNCGVNVKTYKRPENDNLDDKPKKGIIGILFGEKNKTKNNKVKIPNKKEKIPSRIKRINPSGEIEEKGNLEGINNNLANEYNTQVFSGTYPKTGVLSSDGKSIITAGTDILVDEDKILKPTLLRISTSKKVEITSRIFRIGKDESFNDFVIYDNNAISRKHAEISFDNGKYYITDLNSTNKTRVDGNIVLPGYKVELFPKSHIKLANEEFIFEF